MQRILEQHVGSGEFVDDNELAGFPPERGKPATDDGFIRFLWTYQTPQSDGEFLKEKRTRLSANVR